MGQNMWQSIFQLQWQSQTWTDSHGPRKFAWICKINFWHSSLFRNPTSVRLSAVRKCTRIQAAWGNMSRLILKRSRSRLSCQESLCPKEGPRTTAKKVSLTRDPTLLLSVLPLVNSSPSVCRQDMRLAAMHMNQWLTEDLMSQPWEEVRAEPDLM